MKTNKIRMAVAALGMGVVLGMVTAGTSQADTFGSGAYEFTIDFVDIGNENNAADTQLNGTYGAVSYNYRIGTYEISQDAIDQATAGGMEHVSSAADSSGRPAAMISWFEAAAFANWLNTSTGHTAAYNLTYSGGWSMSVWSSGDAWQAGGENLYRHKDAYYFLPNENEWYKAAYYNSAGSNYYKYATGSNTVPDGTYGSMDPNTAVYRSDAFPDYIRPTEPAPVYNAGGLSPYQTMGQSGNVWEWTESSSDNSDPNAGRISRGGGYLTDQRETVFLSSEFRSTDNPTSESAMFGFRMASVEPVPEPSSGLLLVLGGAACWFARKKIKANR